MPAGARHLDNSHDAEVRNLLRVDLLPAPSALDRLQSAAYELVLDGECSRRRQKPGQGRPTHPHRPPT